MSEQQVLDFGGTRLIRERAEQWMAKHPDVVGMFERFALEMASRGRHFGMRLIAERVRWECVFTYDRATFKINDHHTPYIARALIRRHPHLSDYIELRHVRY